jgi:hypothetical protein
MEKLVVTFETAKKLKEAGFPQQTEFMWGSPNEIGAREDYKEGWWSRLHAAPTAQEIADRLPKQVPIAVGEPLGEFYMHHEGPWEAGYTRFGYTEADTMAEALALLWLKLNGEVK